MEIFLGLMLLIAAVFGSMFFMSYLADECDCIGAAVFVFIITALFCTLILGGLVASTEEGKSSEESEVVESNKPTCGHEDDIDYNYCPYCGKEIE